MSRRLRLFDLVLLSLVVAILFTFLVERRNVERDLHSIQARLDALEHPSPVNTLTIDDTPVNYSIIHNQDGQPAYRWVVVCDEND